MKQLHRVLSAPAGPVLQHGFVRVVSLLQTASRGREAAGTTMLGSAQWRGVTRGLSAKEGPRSVPCSLHSEAGEKPASRPPRPWGQGAKLLHNASPSAPASHQAAFSTRLRPQDRAQGRGANAGARGQFPLISSFLFTGTCFLCLFCLLQGLSRHMLLPKSPP